VTGKLLSSTSVTESDSILWAQTSTGRVFSFTLNGDYSGQVFDLTSDGNGGTKISLGVSPVDAFITNASVNGAGNTLSLSGTAGANRVVLIYEDGARIGTTSADVNGNWSFAASNIDGSEHTFNAYTAGFTNLVSNNVVLGATAGSILVGSAVTPDLLVGRGV